MQVIDTVLQRALIYGIHGATETPPLDDKTPEQRIADATAATEAALAEAKTAKDALANQKFTINIDGEEKTLTMEEAKAAISKSGGADKKFREAAENAKAAERGMRIDSLFAQIKSAEDNGVEVNAQTVSELSGLLGIDPTIFQGDKTPNGTKGTAGPPKKITMEDLDATLKSQLEYDGQRNIEDAKQKIYAEVKKKVDKDEIIGRMNSVAVEAGNEAFLATAADVVHEDVLRKINSGELFGAEMIASSIQAARARFKRFGIPEKVTKQKTIIMGLGQPGGEPMQIQPDEPINRVDSSESNYADNFVKRAFQMVAKGSISK